MSPRRVLTLMLLVVLVCLLAVVLATGNAAAKRDAETLHTGETTATIGESLAEFAPLLLLGGAAKSRKARALESENVVIDTLNLTHWLRRRSPLKRVETCDILAAIEETAPIIRRRSPGRVIYVTKDREVKASKEKAARLRAQYQTVARRCGVYVSVVERRPGETKSERAEKSHSSLGRDDFYLIMLAWRYNCPVLSQDHYRDLDTMKSGDLAPFHVFSYSPVKTLPERDFVNPAAAEFRRMRRPAGVYFAEVLTHL